MNLKAAAPIGGCRWARSGTSPAITRSLADQARTIRTPVHTIETIDKLVRTSRQKLLEAAEFPRRVRGGVVH